MLAEHKSAFKKNFLQGLTRSHLEFAVCHKLFESKFKGYELQLMKRHLMSS